MIWKGERIGALSKAEKSAMDNPMWLERNREDDQNLTDKWQKYRGDSASDGIGLPCLANTVVHHGRQRPPPISPSLTSKEEVS